MDVVVGDRVRLHLERDLYVIEQVEPRQNLLYRSDASRVKPLAANIDQLAVVFAPQPTPQEEFLWRALIAAESAGVRPLVIRNKSDLASADADVMAATLQRLDTRVLVTSTYDQPQASRHALMPYFARQRTLFVGQSGMGKSSLMNLLLQTDLRTGELTRRGTHGRQTTTATHWLDLPGGGALIDSPGFLAFGLAHLTPAQVRDAMPDLRAVTSPCRFANCRHDREPDCAVRAAVTAGSLSPERYAFYLRLVAELGA
jgi:ribosome biogenesis GTPase